MGEHKFGKPKTYVKPEGTVFRFKGKQFVVESRPGKRRKKEPPIAKDEVLREIIAIVDETLFSEASAVLYDSKDTTVGRGEKSIRHHNGLSLSTPGSASGLDIPELELEAKEWGKPSSFKLRPGNAAGEKWEAFDLWVSGYIIAPHLLDVFFRQPIVFNGKETTYQRQWVKRISRPFIEAMPEQVSSHVWKVLQPSNMLDEYPNIALVWPTGYIVIPRSDYDVAFQFDTVTQQKPRYTLRRKYLEQRALKALPTYQQIVGTKMKNIGIVIGGFKPPHAGHFKMIEIAARENHEVKLYVSLSDRIREGEVLIKGETIERLWREHYEKALPKNVTVEYVAANSKSSPVRRAYEFLGKENEAGSDDHYKLYGMPNDLNAYFPNTSLEKYADNLYNRRQLQLEPLYTADTVEVSGTDMRRWLHTGEKESFLENCPSGVDGNAVWEALQADGTGLIPKVTRRKKK